MAITYLNSINQFLFEIVKCSFEVWTEFVNNILMSFGFGDLIPHYHLE
jgi:hypothetical protein